MWATIEDIEKQRVIPGLQERLDKYMIEVVDKSGNSNWDFYFIDYDKIPSPVITLFYHTWEGDLVHCPEYIKKTIKIELNNIIKSEN